MPVFVGGPSDAIGARLVPRLIDHGQKVTGTYRSPGNAERVRVLGAEPIGLDQRPARGWHRTPGSA